MIEAAPLLPCPFCGSSHVDMHLAHDMPAPDNGMRFVRCLNCGASTANRQKAEAIASWNERRVLASRLHVVDSTGKKRWLVNEIQRLCDRVLWCQASRAGGDLDADLDALEEQRAVVESLLQERTCKS